MSGRGISEHIGRHFSKEEEEPDAAAAAEERAAIRIQRAWRRRKQKEYLGTDFLWTDLTINARFKVSCALMKFHHDRGRCANINLGNFASHYR